MNNGLGPETYKALTDHFVPSIAFSTIKKLVLKDPMPKRLCPQSISMLLDSMRLCHSNLKVLTLSRLGFDTQTVCFLAKTLNSQHTIEYLDISSNNLTSKNIPLFLELLDDNLKSLNLSYNNGGEIYESLSEYLH